MVGKDITIGEKNKVSLSNEMNWKKGHNTKIDHRSHSDTLFSSLNILKFQDLFNYNCSTFMYNYTSNKLPDSFENIFSPLAVPNRTNSFIIDKTKTKFLEKFPSFFLPKIWNSNSTDIKNSSSLSELKRGLKNNIIASYPPGIRCNSATCPDCKNL